MDNLTLSVQESITLTTGEYQEGIVQTQAQELGLLKALPIKQVKAGAYSFASYKLKQEANFRLVGETIVPSSQEQAIKEAIAGGGIDQRFQQQVVSLAILGDDLVYDTYQILQAGHKQSKQEQVMLKTKAILSKFNKTVLNGDTEQNHKAFDGIIKSCHPEQILKGSYDIGKDMLKLTHMIKGNLDRVFVMSESTLVLLEAENLSRINHETSEFGLPLDHFGIVPIITVPDNELLFGTVIAMNPDKDNGVTLLSTPEGLVVREVGESTEKPQVTTRIEMVVGLAVHDPKTLAIRKLV